MWKILYAVAIFIRTEMGDSKKKTFLFFSFKNLHTKCTSPPSPPNKMLQLSIQRRFFTQIFCIGIVEAYIVFVKNCICSAIFIMTKIWDSKKKNIRFFFYFWWRQNPTGKNCLEVKEYAAQKSKWIWMGVLVSCKNKQGKLGISGNNPFANTNLFFSWMNHCRYFISLIILADLSLYWEMFNVWEHSQIMYTLHYFFWPPMPM